MLKTWDWLFLHLPKDEESKRKVIENFHEQKYQEITVENFILTFDFVEEQIYCDCVPDYLFKCKVIPGKVSFEVVKEFLLTGSWDNLDETKLELLM